MKVTANHPSGKWTCTFDEETHTYIVDQTGQILISGTTFIGIFFPKFDSEAVAKKCAGRKKYKSMTPDDILRQWKAEAHRGQQEGTNVHAYCENFFLRKPLPYPQSDREICLFDVAFNACLKLEERFVFHAAEKIIFSPTLGIAGMIDLEMYDPRKNDILVLDWKQNKEIKKDNPWESAFEPIAHLDSCDWNKYQLQLNLYEFICRHDGYFSDEIKNVRKSIIHLTESHFYPLKVGNLQNEIKKMIEYHNDIPF